MSDDEKFVNFIVKYLTSEHQRQGILFLVENKTLKFGIRDYSWEPRDIFTPVFIPAAVQTIERAFHEEEEQWAINTAFIWDCPTSRSGVVVASELAKLANNIISTYFPEGKPFKEKDALKAVEASELFRQKFVWVAVELQKVDVHSLSTKEKLAFFINVYNALAFHLCVAFGPPSSILGRKFFFSKYKYRMGHVSLSLKDIQKRILLGDSKGEFNKTSDFRRTLVFKEVDSRIYFALTSYSQSSPVLRIYSPEPIYSELEYAARIYFRNTVSLDKKKITLPKILKKSIFGSNDKEKMAYAHKFLNRDLQHDIDLDILHTYKIQYGSRDDKFNPQLGTSA